MFVFQTLNEVREQTEMWLKEYNEERPHDALGDMTPRVFLLTQRPIYIEFARDFVNRVRLPLPHRSSGDDKRRSPSQYQTEKAHATGAATSERCIVIKRLATVGPALRVLLPALRR